MTRDSSLNRRQLLHHGMFFGLPWLTPLAHALSAQTKPQVTRRPSALIVLWLQGGASQLDTFDPHPGKQIAYGAKSIPTAVKDLHFAEGLPQTAELAADFSVIRSMISKEGDHSRAVYNMSSGYRPSPGIFHPGIGSVLCHQKPNSGLEIPNHISILPAPMLARGGYLGPTLDPFQMGDPLGQVPGIKLRVDEERHQKRLDSLQVLEQTFQKGRLPQLDQNRTLHQTNTQRALTMMSSEQLKAFEITEEAEKTKQAFGENRFGRGCLCAVRLVEAGVRCVEVTLNGWDTHTNNQENQRKRVDQLDPALTSLIRELKARDLYESTIVLCATEFGRTPKLNVADGRDHWPHGFSTLIGGGGLRSGKVIGETDPEGTKKKPSQPVSVADLHSTIYTAFDINTDHEFITPTNRPIKINEGFPVEALL